MVACACWTRVHRQFCRYGSYHGGRRPATRTSASAGYCGYACPFAARRGFRGGARSVAAGRGQVHLRRQARTQRQPGRGSCRRSRLAEGRRSTAEMSFPPGAAGSSGDVVADIFHLRVLQRGKGARVAGSAGHGLRRAIRRGFQSCARPRHPHRRVRSSRGLLKCSCRATQTAAASIDQPPYRSGTAPLPIRAGRRAATPGRSTCGARPVRPERYSRRRGAPP